MQCDAVILCKARCEERLLSVTIISAKEAHYFGLETYHRTARTHIAGHRARCLSRVAHRAHWVARTALRAQFKVAWRWNGGTDIAGHVALDLIIFNTVQCIYLNTHVIRCDANFAPRDFSRFLRPNFDDMMPNCDDYGCTTKGSKIISGCRKCLLLEFIWLEKNIGEIEKCIQCARVECTMEALLGCTVRCTLYTEYGIIIVI